VLTKFISESQKQGKVS